MERTPEEIAYWKKVFPETDGKPPFTPYSGCPPGGYRRISVTPHVTPLNYQTPQPQTEKTNEMEFAGYIKNVKETVTTMRDGSVRNNLRITMSEHKDELKDSYPGIVFYVKSDIVENVKEVLSKDPDRNCRYKVKADGWVKEKPSKTNPAEKYDDMYLRAWMFELTF